MTMRPLSPLHTYLCLSRPPTRPHPPLHRILALGHPANPLRIAHPRLRPLRHGRSSLTLVTVASFILGLFATNVLNRWSSTLQHRKRVPHTASNALNRIPAARLAPSPRRASTRQRSPPGGCSRSHDPFPSFARADPGDSLRGDEESNGPLLEEKKSRREADLPQGWNDRGESMAIAPPPPASTPARPARSREGPGPRGSGEGGPVARERRLRRGRSVPARARRLGRGRTAPTEPHAPHAPATPRDGANGGGEGPAGPRAPSSPSQAPRAATPPARPAAPHSALPPPGGPRGCTSTPWAAAART
jgi:hypothetical protein